MDSMIKAQLRELGFSEKEANVYLALTEIGSAVASDIARHARIKRSTAYVILDTLLERGLVSITERQGVNLYNAAPPEQLIQYLQDTAKRYVAMADTAKKLVPALKSSYKRSKEAAPAPKVQLFEGNRGVKTVYEDTLASLEDIRVHAAFGYVRDTAAAPRTESGVKMQVVFSPSAKGKSRWISTKGDLRKQILASRGEEGVSSEINVYDDRIVFISAAEDFAVVIESRELAEALRKTFAASDQKVSGKEKNAVNPYTAPGEFSPAFG